MRQWIIKEKTRCSARSASEHLIQFNHPNYSLCRLSNLANVLNVIWHITGLRREPKGTLWEETGREPEITLTILLTDFTRYIAELIQLGTKRSSLLLVAPPGGAMCFVPSCTVVWAYTKRAPGEAVPVWSTDVASHSALMNMTIRDE